MMEKLGVSGGVKALIPETTEWHQFGKEHWLRMDVVYNESFAMTILKRLESDFRVIHERNDLGRRSSQFFNKLCLCVLHKWSSPLWIAFPFAQKFLHSHYNCLRMVLRIGWTLFFSLRAIVR